MSSNAPQMRSGERFQAIELSNPQKVSYTGTAAASSAFKNATSIVRVIATTDCFILFGADPTATTSSHYLPANAVEYFAVQPDSLWKVSVVRLTSSGDLYVSEGNGAT
jgi:hypothetical protein